jgi:hypothetical protein
MEMVRAPSDQTLALLYRAGRRPTGWLFDYRRLDRESVTRPLRVHRLLKLGEIKLLLDQVRPQLGHRRQDEERDPREKAKRAIGLKN